MCVCVCVLTVYLKTQRCKLSRLQIEHLKGNLADFDTTKAALRSTETELASLRAHAADERTKGAKCDAAAQAKIRALERDIRQAVATIESLERIRQVGLCYDCVMTV